MTASRFATSPESVIEPAPRSAGTFEAPAAGRNHSFRARTSTTDLLPAVRIRPFSRERGTTTDPVSYLMPPTVHTPEPTRSAALKV